MNIHNTIFSLSNMYIFSTPVPHTVNLYLDIVRVVYFYMGIMVTTLHYTVLNSQSNIFMSAGDYVENIDFFLICH